MNMQNMIRVYCAVALVLCVCSQTAAQSIGLKLGPTRSSINRDIEIPLQLTSAREPLPSFVGGVHLQSGGVAVRLQAEMLVVGSGWRIRQETLAGRRVRGDVRVTDFALPLTAVFSLGRNGPYAFVGGQVAFELRCRANGFVNSELGRAYNYEFDGPCDEHEDESIGTFRRNKLKAALVGGVGARIRLSRSTVSIEGRYIGGLTNINADKTTPPVKQQTFAFTAGLAYPLGNLKITF
jgi:hypothetical protein